MKKISMICVYNNKKQVSNLIQSVGGGWKEHIDWVLLDNRKKRYKSAAEALNCGMKIAKTDFFVFLHQDIVFSAPSDVTYIYEKLQEQPNAVLGVAGAKYDSDRKQFYIVTNIHDDKDGLHTYPDNISDLTEVFTLDECLLATSKMVMRRIRFDEKTCSDWHFYGADLCLQAHQKGMGVYVMPLELYHYSLGTFNRKYFKSLGKFANKWKYKYEYLATTTMGVESRKFEYHKNYLWWKYPWTYTISEKIVKIIHRLRL